MRPVVLAAVSALTLAVPRVARAELWINLDRRLIVQHFGGVCALMRTTTEHRVYKCDKTGGASLIFIRESQQRNARPYACTLSYWGSGPTHDTWHADVKDSEAIRCKMHWDNDNTLTITLGDKKEPSDGGIGGFSSKSGKADTAAAAPKKPLRT